MLVSSPMPELAGYCHKCGAQLPQSAVFCPKCGAAVVLATAPQPGAQPSVVRRGERAEKHEKQEKHEKSEKGEKGAGGPMLGTVVGGLILIWLGVSFFLEQNGYVPSDIWWAYFVLGAGVILVLYGIAIHSSRGIGFGPMIGGAIIILIALSTIATNQFRFEASFWPLLLVALGVLVVLAGFASRRRVPAP
jgi:hypothetical protein